MADAKIATTTLKPCPFCGGEAEYVNFVDNDMRNLSPHPVCLIRCKTCKAQMGDFVATDTTFAYKDMATEAWNRRVNDVHSQE